LIFAILFAFIIYRKWIISFGSIVQSCCSCRL